MGMIINQKISTLLVAGFGLLSSLSAGALAPEITCQAPRPVCSARAAVFVISSFDPLAINTRFSLIVALTFSGLYGDAIPPIRKLLPVIPKDANLLRYAIQAAKNTGDKALSDEVLALIKKYNPDRAEAAARFLAAPFGKHEKPKVQ